MVNTAKVSDRGLGLSLTFAVVAVLATIAMGATSYLAFLNEDTGLQVVSGLAFAAALLAGGLSVAAFHLFSE